MNASNYRLQKIKKPLFITLEGTEGSGKSSFLEALKKILKKQKIKCVFTREPGGASVSEKIREIILNEKMNPMTELFLYEAARAEHLHTVILPALQKKHWVICDRFTDSTLSYQGTARGLSRQLIRSLNDVATEGLKPDRTVFLDIDPAKGLKSATQPNRFERESLSFHQKVRKGFLITIKEEPSRFMVMKAKSESPEKMAEIFLEKLSEHLFEKPLLKKKRKQSRS